MTHFKRTKAGLIMAGAVAGVLALSTVVASGSRLPTAPQPKATNPGIALRAPKIPGVPALRGPVAASATPSPKMGLLYVTPAQGVAGTPLRISGTKLPASTNVELTWSTASATWMADPQPDTVNYTGSVDTYFNVVLKHVETNAKGAFSVKTTMPDDFGGTHDIYAVVAGSELDHGGVTLLRKLTVSPRRGPIGTPITVTYTGMGASEYTAGAALLWDNHYAGEMQANWTRGTARVTIRAAGPVGTHFIQVGDAISFLYMNIPQSPLTYATGATIPFTVTRDDGPPAASMDWPASVAPTISARTTLDLSKLAAGTKVAETLSTRRGPVHSKVTVSATGFSTTTPVHVLWSTVVGSRVNCKGICWAFVSQTIGTATPSASGKLSTTVHVPGVSLGGWHVIQLVQGKNVMAEVPYYIEASIVGKGVSSLVVREGASFTIHLMGIGWTQLDNTVAVDYDNSYIGYGCGFNSNGNTILNLHATGTPGTHIIDIYPMLYTASPSFAHTPWGMVPVLSYARDDPGLALGYRLPAMRFAITVVG
jgi:hypothetical protein